MIFVTVGTHEQPFNRVLQYIDDLKKNEKIQEDIVMQTGYSTYQPENCKWFRLLPYQKMVEYVDNARIIITHGGPSSFLMPLQIAKIPIVVPRQKQFDEHVNDHQLEFCLQVSERMNNIIVIKNIEDLGETILNYDKIISRMQSKLVRNNEKFCDNFQSLVDNMFEEQ